MQVGYFTERPYRWLPEEEILKNRAFFAVSNKFFDRERAADDYNYYLDENCGVLVTPTSPEAVVERVSAAMQKLIDDPELGYQLGKAAQQKVEASFDWEQKIDRVLQIYRRAMDRAKE